MFFLSFLATGNSVFSTILLASALLLLYQITQALGLVDNNMTGSGKSGRGLFFESIAY